MPDLRAANGLRPVFVLHPARRGKSLATLGSHAAHLRVPDASDCQAPVHTSSMAHCGAARLSRLNGAARSLAWRSLPRWRQRQPLGLRRVAPHPALHPAGRAGCDRAGNGRRRHARGARQDRAVRAAAGPRRKPAAAAGRLAAAAGPPEHPSTDGIAMVARTRCRKHGCAITSRLPGCWPSAWARRSTRCCASRPTGSSAWANPAPFMPWASTASIFTCSAIGR